MKDISVIIVGLNTRDYVRNCLASLRDTAWGGYSHEIIYIDNASTDDTVHMVETEFPHVRVVQNEKNLGFCKAANQGSRLASGRYLLHLNNDTLVHPDSIPQLASFLDATPNAAVVGGRLLNDDMSDQWSARRFPGPVHSIFGRRSWVARHFPHLKPVRDYLFKDEMAAGKPFQVDWVGTPCMLVRSDAFRHVGGFPEDFYYWHEAVFCAALLREGGTTWTVPTAKVVHFEGKGGGKRSYAVRRWHIVDFHRGAYRFYVQRYGLSRANPFRWLAATGLAGRATLLLSALWMDRFIRREA